MELFDHKLVDIQYDGERYILKRNPIRAPAFKSEKQHPAGLCQKQITQ